MAFVIVIVAVVAGEVLLFIFVVLLFVPTAGVGVFWLFGACFLYLCFLFFF